MAAGDLVDRDFLFRACQGIQFGHQVCYPCLFEDKFDVIVVSLRTLKWQELSPWHFCISIDNLFCNRIQRHNNCTSILLDSLCWNILYCSIDDITLFRFKAIKQKYLPHYDTTRHSYLWQGGVCYCSSSRSSFDCCDSRYCFMLSELTTFFPVCSSKASFATRATEPPLSATLACSLIV